MLKTLFFTLTFVLSITLTIFPQTPQPTASPKNDDEVVKISTNLIQVDVTVTDKDGKIIKDLKPSDFEVFENGKKQDITNFSFISGDNKKVSENSDIAPPKFRP